MIYSAKLLLGSLFVVVFMSCEKKIKLIDTDETDTKLEHSMEEGQLTKLSGLSKQLIKIDSLVDHVQSYFTNVSSDIMTASYFKTNISLTEVKP